MVISTTDTVGGDLPIKLGGGEGTVTSVLAQEFDVYLSTPGSSSFGLNLHITRDTPYQRETAEWRKEQVDQAAEAGEQTLSSWWLRSQMSFHGGAGIKFLDTVFEQNSPNRIRFDDSRGIDVWTQGEIKRLPDTEFLSASSGRTWIFGTTLGAESYIVFGYSGTVKAIRKVAADTITYTITGMSGTIKSMTIDGSHYYVATSDGHVFKGPIDNSASGAAVWDFTSSKDVTLGWAKQRLMAGIDNEVFELAGTGPALPTALYTHPSTGWRWTAFADAPDAVIGSGYSGLNSALMAFALSDASGAPELTTGISIAEMPVGEQIHSLYLYVGSHLVIGTSLGVRVGTFDSLYGSFSFGPLTVETDTPVKAIAGRGAFVFCGTTLDGGNPALIRIDLGTVVENGRFAWATDLRVPVSSTTGDVTGITVSSDGLLVFAVSGYGLVAETDTYTGREAWLRTARIRMTTVEPKRFKRGRIRAEGAGVATISAVSDTYAEAEVYSAATDEPLEEFALPSGRAEWVQLTFELEDLAKITSYQVLALPAQTRQRLFALPVAIFDAEKNRRGRTIGYPGRAKDLLNLLENLESSGEEIVVQCPILGIDATRCIVERIEFRQQSPVVGGRSVSLGGYGNLVFRTLT